MSGIKRLFGSAVSYTLANVLNSAIPFFLLPVLTRVLTPGEYGAVTMFATVMGVISAFTGMSVHGAVSVRYFDKETDHPLFVGACLTVLAASTSVVLVVVALLAAPLEGFTQVPKFWLLMAVLGAAMNFVIQVRLVMWQVADKPFRFGIFQFAQTAFNLSLSIFLIITIGLSWEGRLLGILTALLVFGCAAFVSLNYSRLVKWRVNIGYIKDALRFGVPLIPHALGGVLISLSDRFIITALMGLEATGAYAVGAQLAMLIGILASSFIQAYAPHLYSKLSSEDAGTKLQLVKYSLAVYLGFFCVAILFWICIPLVYLVFVGEQFQDSVVISRLLAFGYALEGMYFAVAGFLFYLKKTAMLARLTIFCGIVNVPLTYYMVDGFGLLGAAWSFVLIQTLFFIGAWFMAQKFYPLPWMRLLTVLAGRTISK
ncbi:lipopolysaccharide biosynthesis protein [Stutzerimonas nitrititolerans]|uniref:lipopolysaccharide biosynthesis protein n=1 Tax=Stutzerimonas nitrititolerans TaxID=2482751 RepID=UPI003AA7E477